MHTFVFELFSLTSWLPQLRPIPTTRWFRNSYGSPTIGIQRSGLFIVNIMIWCTARQTCTYIQISSIDVDVQTLPDVFCMQTMLYDCQWSTYVFTFCLMQPVKKKNEKKKNTVRKMKWSWAGHINRLKDDRWTSRVTSWRPYDKKRRQGRPAKRWRDDLDKYWSDTIWQRKAQDRVVWRQHAEAFAQPRDTTAA